MLRRRVVLAILLLWPLGYAYLYWSLYTVENIARHYRNGYGICDGSWRSSTNFCNTSFSAPVAWAELIGISSVLLALTYLAARWALRPVGDMARTVREFGPTGLGLRLRAQGPKDELRHLADSIDTMLGRLAEGYAAQRRFASTASHELRTPLATQRALIEVSMSHDLTPDGIDLLSRQLIATNERNEKLVDGLLTLAETDQGLLANVPLQLDRIALEVIETLRLNADENQVTIDATLAPVAVLGEEPLIERMVSNLVHNAIKYNEPGGRVDVRLTLDGALTIENTGPVVPPELVAGLFEPFRRLSGERLDHGGGVGLGLTIVRSIVAAHGGAVRAHACPGGGLVVKVLLAPAG
ncbi:MAG: hypothetical protein QOE97_322 [Pseudonocardiales bacterium]|nr:hypothetical protein [Pseudonocardiales bacterium]